MIKWAVLELMGHNRHIGRVSEVQLFGSPMGQMEELDEEGNLGKPIHFNAASVYRLTEITEEDARERVKPYVYAALPAVYESGVIPELDPFCTGETDCDCFNCKPAHVRFVPMGLPPGPSGEEAF
jgi:hypothetical protein